MKFNIMILVLLLASCDGGSERDFVQVQYVVRAASEDAVADVIYQVRDGVTMTSKDIQAGMVHVFETEEGSELLYIQLSNVRNGEMSANIIVDDQVIQNFTAIPGTSRAVSAWGTNERIVIHYTATTLLPGTITFHTPQSEEMISTESRRITESRTFIAPPDFESRISVASSKILEGTRGCVSSRIEFEPVRWQRLLLAAAEKCSPEQTDLVLSLHLSATVPGF